MDVQLIKSFLEEHLSTRKDVSEAAAVVGVSIATMYRFKAQPELMKMEALIRLNETLNMPLQSGAVWSKLDVLKTERLRLQLERRIAKDKGTRYTTVAPYTVNSELPEITKILIEADYGIDAPSLLDAVLEIRKERQQLYESGTYASWEIWNGYGYYDFFHGKNRFKSIPSQLRKQQVAKFVETSTRENVHRFVYLQHCPEIPMFGIYNPPGVCLVRIDDIHLEYQSQPLTKNFSETFDGFVSRCVTKTSQEFIQFLKSPTI